MNKKSSNLFLSKVTRWSYFFLLLLILLSVNLEKIYIYNEIFGADSHSTLHEVICRKRKRQKMILDFFFVFFSFFFSPSSKDLFTRTT